MSVKLGGKLLVFYCQKCATGTYVYKVAHKNDPYQRFFSINPAVAIWSFAVVRFEGSLFWKCVSNEYIVAKTLIWKKINVNKTNHSDILFASWMRFSLHSMDKPHIYRAWGKQITFNSYVQQYKNTTMSNNNLLIKSRHSIQYYRNNVISHFNRM